jgi:hypothetical protein
VIPVSHAMLTGIRTVIDISQQLVYRQPIRGAAVATCCTQNNLSKGTLRLGKHPCNTV